jgi:hypothetical protein
VVGFIFEVEVEYLGDGAADPVLGRLFDTFGRRR